MGDMTGKCTKIVQHGKFWLLLDAVEKKKYFCPKFNLFWWCPSRCMMMMKPIFVQFMANHDAIFEHPVVRVQYTNFYYSVFYL